MKVEAPALLIETPALIKLEGTEVLTFLARAEDHAIYRIIGFNENPIRVIDYRGKGLETIDRVIRSKQIEQFPEGFCYPARVRISQSEQEVLIELFELADERKLEIMLWITTDLGEPIPDYKYIFFRIEPRTASFYSFVSLFNYYRFQAHFHGMVLQMQVESQI